MVDSTLSRHRRREQHRRCGPYKSLDKGGSHLLRQMLCHFQANSHVVPAVHFKGPAQIRACEAFGRNKKLRAVNVLTIESPNRAYAQFPENLQPGSSPAANIEGACGAKEALQDRKYDPRR